MQFIDSHSHIDFPEFKGETKSILKKAADAGVSNIVVSATTAKRWHNIKALVSEHQGCFAAYGLHPMFMDEYRPKQLDDLKAMIKAEKPIAVGEVGLDYFIKLNDEEQNKKDQLRLFVAQLELASEFNLPVIIHARKSLDLVLKELRIFPQLSGSIHSFSGSEQQAKQLIDLGFYLGFGGPITYTRATRLRKLVTSLPLDSLLLETDSPDQPDSTHYGERNEPSYLPTIAAVIAQLRGVDIEIIADVTTTNAQKLFNFGSNKLKQ